MCQFRFDPGFRKKCAKGTNDQPDHLACRVFTPQPIQEDAHPFGKPIYMVPSTLRGIFESIDLRETLPFMRRGERVFARIEKHSRSAASKPSHFGGLPRFSD